MPSANKDSVDSLSQDVASRLHISGEQGASDSADSASTYYELKETFININDLTLHTLRTAWLLLVKSLPYNFSAYLEEGKEFPDVKPFARFEKHSSLVYVFGIAVGTLICEAVKYEWPATEKKAFGKGSGKPKPEPLALVILATAVLEHYRGLNLAKRLFDATLKKATEARIYKIFVVVDTECQKLYEKLGFVATEYVPMDLDLQITDKDGGSCNFSFMEYTIANKVTS